MSRVAVGAVAKRVTSPLSLFTHPLASTIVVGALSIVELVAGLVLERFSREAESSTQSTCTALLLRTCLGLGGKPPRPVMINSFSPAAEQPVAKELEASTNSAGNSTNP